MKQLSKSISANNPYWFLLYLLWPVLAVVLSIKHRKYKIAKTIFILCCMFFGFTFIHSTNYDSGSDSARYAQWLIEMHNKNLSWDNFIKNLYIGDNGATDILQPLLTYLVSLFTDDVRFLFALFALVLGYFYAQNIWLLFERIKQKLTKTDIIFITTFFLLIPIWEINGFRFWTASHLFIYGTYLFLIYGKNKKYLWIASLSIFVHFSFFAPLIILLIYALVGNQTKLYFIIFIASVFVNQIGTDFVKSKAESLPEVFQKKSNTYLTEEVMTDEMVAVNATNWYIKYNATLLNGICYAFLIFLFFKGLTFLNSNLIILNLFNFSLIYYSFANIANSLPQGSRFFAVGQMLVFFLIAILPISNLTPLKLPLLKKIATPFLIIIIVVEIRIGFEFTGLLTIIGNPLVMYWMENGQPIIDFIK